MTDQPHLDLRLDFRNDGLVDLQLRGREVDTIDAIDNLIQALKMRLSISETELSRVGHPRYGNRIHELVGEPLSRRNLELLRRHIRRALLADPRVAKIEQLDVVPLPAEPGVVDVQAVIVPNEPALLGPAFVFGVVIDVG
ncbi:MAG: DUF2634 domain-containing protein [Deltaproteobacteria bacterium]|nr:DUF2634 domain-containing protein [Deltaproteobacteria bacterium]